MDVDQKNLYGLTALHIASERGHMKVVKVLVRARAKIDQVDIRQSTPLMLAASGGHHDVVGYLIACNANVYKKNLHNQTALHFASERGHMEVVKVLLIARAKIDAVDISHSTPLMLAARESHQDIVSHLSTKGASVDRRDCDYRTTLHYASERGDLEMVKLLLNAGAKIDEVDGSRSTPLMLAACEGHHNIVSHLIAFGASVDKKGPNNQTALHYASERGNLEVVKTLLNAGAKIDEVNGHQSTPLMLATLNNHVEIISCLLYVEMIKQDASRVLAGHIPSGNTLHEVNITHLTDPKSQLSRDVLSYAINQKYKDVAKVLITKGVGIEGLLSTSPPMTALMWTAQEGYDCLTKELILPGVNINYQNPDGCTALHYAARSGHLHIAQILLNNGAEIDSKVKHHYTPLVLSVMAEKYDVMLHLITSGADVAQLGKHPDRDLGREALSYAINSKNVIAFKLLITKGVGIHSEGLLSTRPPVTALMWTAQEGYDSLTKQLILQGLNVNYHNPDGHTALHFAARSGRLEIVKILLNNGAEIDPEDKHHHTPLVLSVETKKYDVMLHLITSGADVAQLAKHTYPIRDRGREALSYAVTHKHKDIAKIMITKGVSIEGLLSISPLMTALMWTSQEGDDSLTKQLILQGVNINFQNFDGHTALHFASWHNHTQCGILLVEAGADVSIVNKASQTPLDLSSNEFKGAILQTLSFQTKKTVCVIGNAMSGKSTLIASLKNENANFVKKFCNWLFGVWDISERTAGIEPVSLSSKRYGDVMFFDFAGQHEYHGPHEMFLESILSKGLSTVTIIVVVKATDEESAICHQLNRWLHPFVKMSSLANPVRVIVIGSYMDKVKNEVEAKEKLELCYETIKDSLRDDIPVTFEDLCYLDCRQPYSSDISKLCDYLKDVPPPQNKAMHIGYSITWVITRIRSSIDKKVISVSEFSDWIAYNKANLPTNLPPAEVVCKDLSSTGHFLYLPSKEGTSNGWLVLDLPSILHKVYGTLFSPSKKIVNKFGLLNCQRLSVLFPTLDPSLVRDVLISLEFCIEVDPSILSESTHLMDSSDEGLEHLFFPALVSAKPPIVFSDECKGNQILYWQLEISENSFLSPRLLQTIILQLAAHNVFHHQQGSKTREHYCSVWWNGIFWRSTRDADVAVQISDNAVVQVIGRSVDSPEGLCVYMSRVIQDIFDTIRTVSPHLSGTEYIIKTVNPQDLLKNPRSSPPQDKFPVDIILESTRNGGSTCLSCNTEKDMAERKAVSAVFCGFQPSVDVIEKFSMSACECVLVYICPYIWLV